MNCIVCVFLINGLLVNAFPANDGVDNGVHITVPVTGVAEFSGTAQATGSVALLAHTPCPEITLPFIASTLENDRLPKNSEAGEEIDATMAESDAFVEKKLQGMGSKMQIATQCSPLDSTLQQMESELSTELSKFDEFLESELANTEEMVQSALRKVQLETDRKYDEITETVTNELTEQDALIQISTLILQSFVESKLAETENLVKAELEKVNTFVDSELEKVDAIVESESANINLAVETELEKTDALIQSELMEMESVVKSNIAKMESLVESESEKVDRFIEAELAKTDAFVNSELSKIQSVLATKLEKVEKALDVGDSCTMSSDSVPMMVPVPIYAENYSGLTLNNDESYTQMLPYIDTGFAPPTIGTRNPIITLNEAPYDSQYLGKTAPVLYHRNQLPMVNVVRGTARATGHMKLFYKFPCPPLQATEIGPDGKKCIWIKKKSCDKEKPSKPKVEFPDVSVTEIPTEANYEDLSSEEPEDFVPLGPIPIRGETVFEGKAPAYGSVSITGHSVEAVF
ncbi:uncharacterized protein LOC133531977 [Cydia pomonella]|uniref:uncharacterized protein LOC133531977 n=1 Tax=Cydia pomonella TaxID=82600 RepID=UPI002ADE55DF|nr:uncharacterized protein LOC133531977 [Cydia pomonella]